MDREFWREVLVGQAVGLPLAVVVGLLDWDERLVMAVAPIAALTGMAVGSRRARRRGLDWP
jgi:hypothetical protein